MTQRSDVPKQADVVIVGAGHNGLVAAVYLARAGLDVVVVEDKAMVGGAAKTEYPFTKAPGVGTSSGAYLLGLAPPELLAELDLQLPLRRRDPHYFLPTTDHRYLMFGSDQAAMERQFRELFSEADWKANQALVAEVSALRDDVAPTWLEEPLSIEETAAKYVRPALRETFIKLCRDPISEYLARFDFKSDLIRAMYAVTDAFSGLHGGFDTPGTGMNFLVHNMCRLPGSDGTWMIVEGGMGVITQRLAQKAREAGAEIFTSSPVARIESLGGHVSGVSLTSGETIIAKVVVANADPYRTRALAGGADSIGKQLSSRLDEMQRDGSTMKVNLCFEGLPTFTCLPEDKGQFGPTIHLLPDEENVIAELRAAHRDARAGKLPDFPSIEWYFHTPIDRSLCDDKGRHNSALFVEWVPYELKGDQTWEQAEAGYVKHLLSICDRFAPDTSSRVVDTFTLTPAGVEKHFGITYGHIHHIDNGFGFADRVPYRFGLPGLYSCSAGTHPAGSVIGAAGHNAAKAVLKDLGR